MMSEAFTSVLQKTQSLARYSTRFEFFAEVLKSCALTSNTKFGKVLHGNAIKEGHSTCHIIFKALLNMYAKCNVFEDCQKLFGDIPCRDTVTFNILLSGLANSRKHDDEVVGLFNELLAAQDSRPSPVTLAIALPVCTRSGMLDAGMSTHAYAIKSGMALQTLVGNALVSMYAKCGLVLHASAIFHGIAEKDAVSYNALIAGFARNNLLNSALQIFGKMIRAHVAPNYTTIANILPICASLEDTVGYRIGKQIHCYVLQRPELEEETMVINALMSFYVRIGRVEEAQSLFHRMKIRDLVSWNSIIAGYASNGEMRKALKIFREFIDLNMICLDSVTLVTILPVCAHLHNLQVGKELHGYVFRRVALLENTSVGNALTNFYSKCECIDAAFWTFLLIPKKDLISWNSLLDAFAINRMETKFAELLRWMFVDGIKPDAVTLLTVLQFCATLSKVENVKETHAYALRSCLLLNDNEPTLGNRLIDAYAKCSNIGYASKVFENFSGSRNVVTYNSIIAGHLACGSQAEANMIFQNMCDTDLTTWNLMVKGHAQNECPIEALNFFHELQIYGMKPDTMTILSILPVCGQMASGRLLKQCHAYCVRACFDDIHLTAAFVDMYSKCAMINSAYKVYLSTPSKDLVVFSAMLGGYALHGMGKEAIHIYGLMLGCGIKPDYVVLTAVLSACRHSGLVNEGFEIFKSIVQVHNMKPDMEQYACVIDLLARGGRIEEALLFLNQMPVAANANMWATLLGACKVHHDVDVGRIVADELLKTKNNDIGTYVVLSNLYAVDARWEGVQEMRKLMKTRDLKKPAGCSWVEVGNCKNVFVAGDYSHPNRDLIYSVLNDLDIQIKELDESYDI